MYKFANKGEIGAPCGEPRFVSLFRVVRCTRPHTSVSSAYHDVGYPSPRKTGFQALAKLSWAGFHPQSSYKRFSTHFMWVGLLFQASWHKHFFFP